MPFLYLEASGLKNRYFCRTARYALVGETLRVLNSDHNPSVIPLTPWEARVYELANGEKTVNELVNGIADQYGPFQAVPANLDKVLLDILERFIKDYRIVELHETPMSLPYYLSLPIHKQDEVRANTLMRRDRFED